jgi:hypothetical protein
MTIEQIQGLGKLKKNQWPTGFEPVTFQLVV